MLKTTSRGYGLLIGVLLGLISALMALIMDLGMGIEWTAAYWTLGMLSGLVIGAWALE